MQAPSEDEEEALLLEKLQWSRMRMNEAASIWQMKFYDLMQVTQALIDHMEGKKR